MKNIAKFMLMSLVAMLIFTSCTKDENICPLHLISVVNEGSAQVSIKEGGQVHTGVLGQANVASYDPCTVQEVLITSRQDGTEVNVNGVYVTLDKGKTIKVSTNTKTEITEVTNGNN